MRAAAPVLIAALALGAAGCETTPDQGGGRNQPLPVGDRARDRHLESLFDATSSPDEAVAEAAANEIAGLPAGELRNFGVHWGVRGRDPVAAGRIGYALGQQAEQAAVGSDGSSVPAEAARLANEALVWYRRGLAELDPEKDYVTGAHYRLLMARAFLVLGQGREAIELLANRLDTRPLPPELEAAYDQILDSLKK